MSRELEALERIKNKEILIDIEMSNTFYNEYEDLHDSFSTIEAVLKVLETIKECVGVDMILFNAEQYGLPKEEFDLLKEVLL